MYSEPEGVAFIERQWGRQTNGEGLSLAIESVAAGQAVGLIAALFRSQPGVVGLGYWVVPPERGHRYARLAIGLLSRWLLTETVTTRVEAYVQPGNRPSRRSLESCGLREEGRAPSYIDGKHDAILYSLVRNDLVV